MKYFQLDTQKVLNVLDTDPATGLNSEEARLRLKRFGYNDMGRESGISPWSIFLNQFRDTIVHILLGAVVFAIIAGEYTDSIIILSILVMNGVIGFFQEFSAQKSIESLKNMAAPVARVLRDGEIVEIAARLLVPGDIIVLKAGERVPADARVIESVHLKVAEDMLTGESIPVVKHSQAIDQAVLQPGDQLNMVFCGTNVVSGHGRAVVTATGTHSEIGRIATMVREHAAGMTPLQKRLHNFGKKLGVVIAVICITVFLLFVIRDWISGVLSIHSLTEFLFIAISLAVAAVPTALPAVVTIALSVGVKRLLVRKALVRRLSSVETLGSCDVICTDKTGTLTENRMSVRFAWTPEAEAMIEGDGYSPEGSIRGGNIPPLLFEAGLVCSHATIRQENGEWTAVGDPTEAALVASAARAGVESHAKALDEIPFDSSRKRMSVLVAGEDGATLMFTKGAPDMVLQCCTDVFLNGEAVPLTDELRNAVLEQNERYAEDALRVLGFAFKSFEKGKEIEFEEQGMVFLGLQAMMDPPRQDVVESVRKTREAGIRVLMITGDYPATAEAVGRMIGIDGKVVTGYELEKMDDSRLNARLAEGANIFARVAPVHKRRIVDILMNDGHTVAMIGDGVNDAPALSRASIGVALGSGTDVAKDAADFILLDDSFTNMVNAIEEGRGIYDNIQKSVMLLLSGNLGEVLIIFLAALAGLHLPLTATMLLWINMITDGAPALAYAVDPYAADIMKRRPVVRNQNILPGPKIIQLSVLGVSGAITALLIFYFSGGASHSAEEVKFAQTMVFNYVIMYESVLVFAIRREYGARLFSNWWLWASVLISLAFQGVLMYTPLSTLFRITPLALSDLGLLAAYTACFGMVCAAYSVTAAIVEKRGITVQRPWCL